ncbi:cytochrome P450 [Pseudomassariella vexata]|uniref:Cytochrome P450 n=1 Tax=Pseudomassariella vexata TaxID=1141098 RepID=A0A1Y2DT99_9PEZI|nr:cytochrome P450 [Pseudomassariella vexata]ORY62501.1 cytochrome P450 [Pseudomassariella vexata]
MDSIVLAPSHAVIAGSGLGNKADAASIAGGVLETMMTTGAGKISTIVLASIVALFLLDQFFTAKVDPQEPPLLKPRFPLIGHLVGMMLGQQSYFQKLHKRNSPPIYTLPVLNGKIYIATSPPLIQSALRGKDLSFDPFVVDFAQKLLGLDEATMAIIRDESKGTTTNADMTKAIHGGLSGGNLLRTNRAVLEDVAAQLNAFPLGNDGLEIPDFWIWLRNLLSAATTKALYGKKANPFDTIPTMFDDLWQFDTHTPTLMISPFPWLTHPKTLQARARLQAAVVDWYTAGNDKDPDIAAIAAYRAETLRRHGFSARQIGQIEISLALVSMQNAIPTLLWLVLNVYQRPGWVERIRLEILDTLQEAKPVNGMRQVQIYVSSLEEKAPFLLACYKEAVRIGNAQLGTRRVMQDTYISDGKGNRYLVKKGIDMLMPCGVMHRLDNVWESDTDSFNPNNFLSPEQKGLDPQTQSEREKLRKASYIPFGGGKHYCPGRKFAMYEIMALMATLVVGFHVSPLGGGEEIQMLEMMGVRFGEAVAKPKRNGEGCPVRLKRKEGWEAVRWRFVC